MRQKSPAMGRWFIQLRAFIDTKYLVLVESIKSISLFLIK
ncbi:hypothetical protein TREPR_0865 [Treponema primitia ZAS-2]|uniref:Uncharacterized protein n=1 Tax=Treponema primitia (strain ATCC BAA-887 / DSM 12427 / ZAS-2) TaxID=545694 RepID=F5YIN1_TREPZ|nr:hypothetical protein TREPR_0865 [Treponema primitia ZAS-2]